MSVKKAVNYFHDQYGLTLPHSDVIDAVNKHGISAPCEILDLGSGQGRNSLYLSQLGFKVDAVEKNPLSIDYLNKIIKKEGIENISVESYNINEATIEKSYDWIISTVVFMFLNRDSIPDIIGNMQESTNRGGYNLIVSAMSTERYPAPNNFNFTFDEGELKRYYQGWEFLEYNEDVGELHRRDQQGNRMQMQFVTMLARKP